jgi:hypothetical protein
MKRTFIQVIDNFNIVGHVDSEPAITSADIPAVKPEKHVILVHQNV